MSAKASGKNTIGKKSLKILGRAGIVLLTVILALVITVIGALMVLYYGPSTSARDRFVLTVTETSAGGILATWFLPRAAIDEIIASNQVEETEDTTDTSLIVIPGSKTDKGKEQTPGTDGQPVTDDVPDEYDPDRIELIDITGKTYKGKLLIVYNPKRVFIGTPEVYGEDKQGVSTINMVRSANALYGVNGGGFYDTGSGNGGVPTGRENSPGIVISRGKLMWGSRGNTYELIGINKDGIMVLGKMTGQQALDQGIVEAINFGPYLIVNGEPCSVQGFSWPQPEWRSSPTQQSSCRQLAHRRSSPWPHSQ